MAARPPDGPLNDIGLVVLAILGGAIGDASRGNGWRHSVLSGVGAGFVGLLVSKLCHYAALPDDVTFVVVGIAGWLGASRSMQVIEALIEKKLGLTGVVEKDKS